MATVASEKRRRTASTTSRSARRRQRPAVSAPDPTKPGPSPKSAPSAEERLIVEHLVGSVGADEYNGEMVECACRIVDLMEQLEGDGHVVQLLRRHPDVAQQ